MNRLPYEITKVFYDTLGLQFEEFNPAQFAAISATDRFPLIGGGERGGKAIPVNTRIPTPSGWKILNDIHPGDYVFGDDGNPALVTWESSIQYNRPCMKVVFDDGTEIIADAEHEWATQSANERKNSRRKKINGKEERVQEPARVIDRKYKIRTTKEISESLVVKGSNRSDFANYTVVNTLPVKYQSQELEVDPYTFGVWLGDGHKQSAMFATNDFEVVENISKAYSVRKLKAKFVWGFGERGEIVSKLRKLNVFKNKHIPDKYLQSSIEDRVNLLQGLMDSDGYIDIRGQCYFDNTNYAIITGLRELLSSLGIKSYLTENRAMLHGKDCGPVWTVYFVSDFPVSRIKRKYERQKLSVGKNAKQRAIVSIEDVESVPVKCISVDNDSHLYLAGDSYIPTHNSFASAAILLPHLYLLPEVRKERFYLPNGTLRYNPNVKRPLTPDFSIFGPTYAEPTIEFSYIENWLRELDDISYLSKPKEGSWSLVTKKGVVLTTWSTKDPATIRAIDLEGAVVTEAGNMEEDAIYRINGRVGAKRGFIVYNGTFENAKRWYIRWAQEGDRQNNKRIKTYHLPSWSNLHEFPGGRNDDEIKRWEELYPEDIFATRVAAEPLPPRDRVIQEINEDAIRKVKIPRTPTGEIDARIELAIDPGYLPSAYAVLWVASWDTEKGRFWYIFDELYEQRKETTEIIDAIKLHKFYKTCRSDDLTIDVSSKRHADGNEPSIEIYRRLTKFKNPYMKYWHEKALIERLRTTAKQGLIAIHPNCTGLIAELGLGEEVFPDMHPWKYPSNREGVIIGDKPKDAWNHSAKALGYLLLRHLGQVERLGDRPKPKNRIAEKKTIFDKKNKRGY